jgi:PleD family two-component response regulator
LCKRITQKLGGDITLQTEYGKGSTFTFYVEAGRCEPPLADPQVSLAPLVDQVTDSEQAVLHDLRNDSTTPLPDSSHATVDRAAEDILNTSKTLNSPIAEQQEELIHILLAEDNIINQRLLQRQLVKAGFKVSVANNGVEALEHLHSTPLPLHCILMGEPVWSYLKRGQPC